ncbi:MAG TPA: glycoside hydrolase family 97 N-terminal domain-containing protein, partial [Tepidisphaeraceae bacterium]|nr:glycoside hydrolase family 97 N-terminal domain-containing protein [Tepidisphaeraceae bacterium]
MSDFALSISSPNGETELRITVAPDHELYRVSPGTLRAEIVRRGARVVDCRTIGLQCDGAPPLMSCLHARVIDRQSRDQTWSPVLSENATVPDRHESVVLSLEEALEPRRRLEMEFRVYDDAVALRYRVPRDATAGISVRQESVRLQFAEGATGYQQTYPEDRYQLTPLEQLHTPTEAPLVIRTPPCPFVGLLEAANLDWPGLKFTADARRPGSVRFHLTGEATLDPGAVSPWRVIRVVDRAIDLVGTSDLIATLCPPCAVSDTRWIRPGKAIRDITLSTAGGLACIEFARRRGLRHILYDAGWYGHEYDDAADARQGSP